VEQQVTVLSRCSRSRDLQDRDRTARSTSRATVFKYPDEQGVRDAAMAFWHWYLRDANAAQHEKLGPDTFDVRRRRPGRGAVHALGGQRPFIPKFREVSNRDRSVLPNPIVMGDQIWIYVAGINMEHNGNIDPAAGGQVRTGIGRAILRLDGFMSADAPYEGGEFVTVPLRYEGDALELNLDTSGGGYAQIELLDEGGKPIPGYPGASLLCGNSSRCRCRGNQKRRSLAGSVRLRCYLRDSNSTPSSSGRRLTQRDARAIDRAARRGPCG
jgi:hypothetical protein